MEFIQHKPTPEDIQNEILAEELEDHIEQIEPKELEVWKEPNPELLTEHNPEVFITESFGDIGENYVPLEEWQKQTEELMSEHNHSIPEIEIDVNPINEGPIDELMDGGLDKILEETDLTGDDDEHSE